MARARFVGLAVVLLSCGAPARAPEEPATPTRPRSCDEGDASSCRGLARERRDTGDAAGERAALERGCALGDAACCCLAAATIRDREAPERRALLQRGSDLSRGLCIIECGCAY